MTHSWVPRVLEQPGRVALIQQELNQLPEALARVLVLRGIDSLEGARLFFRPRLEDLHDPFLMKGMRAASERVAEAVRRGEKILVYGDYDVDGTTATTLMVRFLRERGAEVDFFIPDRIEHGYGLRPAGIDYAVDAGARLVVTLDCGITAVQEARYARDRGLDLIICDHHKPDDEIPEALAVLNPKQVDCPYPFKELSGCGVGFKLTQGVLSALGEPPETAYPFLDLVAISIAGDIVPIMGENRVLMAEGLKRLTERPRLGLKKLAELAGIDLAQCSTSRIVFSLGPRINAAGRMGDACRAVELMLEDDEYRAAELAWQLEQANRMRRTLDQTTLSEAEHLADEHLGSVAQHSLVLFQPEWHLGVIGIVASRLVERFYRPTVMLAASNGEAKGSARSIQGVNIYDALKACEDLLTTFGGHDYAAGLTIPTRNVTAFRLRFDEVVSSFVTPEVLTPSISVDALLNLNEIDRRFWAVLRQFAPHGPENDTPVFQANGLEAVGAPQRVGRSGEHLKVTLRHAGDDGGLHFEAIGFGMRERFGLVQESARGGSPLDALFTIQENNWNGRTSLQLHLKDVRPSE